MVIEDQFGKRIKLTKTDASDIEGIIDFEESNRLFVGSYDKEKHLGLLKNIDCLHLSIRRLDNDQLIGHMILFGLDGRNKSMEFRRITVNQKGMGYGREVLQLLKRLCFNKLHYHRLWLDVFDDNDRAIKLYESEGFIKEAVLRENTKTENGYRSQRVYAILENEYQDF